MEYGDSAGGVMRNTGPSNTTAMLVMFPKNSVHGVGFFSPKPVASFAPSQMTRTSAGSELGTFFSQQPPLGAHESDFSPGTPGSQSIDVEPRSPRFTASMPSSSATRAGSRSSPDRYIDAVIESPMKSTRNPARHEMKSSWNIYPPNI